MDHALDSTLRLDPTTIVGTYDERDTAAIMAEHPHLLIIHTYQYNELSPTAQERAREWFTQGQRETGEDLHDGMFQDDVRILLEEEFGIKAVQGEFEIHYSLGHCQGDGVAFQGTINTDALMRHNAMLCETVVRDMLAQSYPFYEDVGEDSLIETPFHLDVEVKDEGRNSHWNSMRFDITLDSPAFEGWFTEDLIKFGERVERMVEGAVQGASGAAEAMGYQEIEYNQSDEHAADMILGNEWRFTKDGARSVTL